MARSPLDTNVPALGSRVTVLVADGMVLSEVWRHDGLGVFTWMVMVPGFGGQSGTANMADENVLWCRGRHAGNSAEVKAMKVARALGPDESALDLHKADNLFKLGVMSEKTWLANLDRWDTEFEQGRR